MAGGEAMAELEAELAELTGSASSSTTEIN